MVLAVVGVVLLKYLIKAAVAVMAALLMPALLRGDS
jgi:hypothetical protein